MSLNLTDCLPLDRCPHCSVAKPFVNKCHELWTDDGNGQNKRFWRIYRCSHCGGIISAWAPKPDLSIREMFPQPIAVDDAIPDRARSYLRQAIDSLHAPAGAVMLTASSVDAMLKEKGYRDGSLSARINNAAEDHLITTDMAKWAHEVRLDANDQRHSDSAASLPDQNDARKCIAFAKALAEFLFVLPAQIQRGLESTKTNTGSSP